MNSFSFSASTLAALATLALIAGCGGGPTRRAAEPTLVATPGPSAAVIPAATAAPAAIPATPVAEPAASEPEDPCWAVHDELARAKDLLTPGMSRRAYEDLLASPPGRALRPGGYLALAKLFRSDAGATESAAQKQLTDQLVPGVRQFLAEAEGQVYLTLSGPKGRVYYAGSVARQSVGMFPDGPTAVKRTTSGGYDLFVLETSGGSRECERVHPDDEVCIPSVRLDYETVLVVVDAARKAVRAHVTIDEGSSREPGAVRATLEDRALVVHYGQCKRRFPLATLVFD